MILEVLKTLEKVRLEGGVGITRETAKRKDTSLLVIELEELHDRVTTRERVRRDKARRERDVLLRSDVEHDVHKVPTLLLRTRHRCLPELVGGVGREEAALGRRIVYVDTIGTAVGDAVVVAEGLGVTEGHGGRAKARAVGKLARG